MKICTYDNPASMQRECWENGRLLCAYTYEALIPHARIRIPPELFFFGANVGEWKAGRMFGDPGAMLAAPEAKP